MENTVDAIKMALPVGIWERLEKVAVESDTSISDTILEAAIAYLDERDKHKTPSVYSKGFKDGRENGYLMGFEAGYAHAIDVLKRHFRPKTEEYPVYDFEEECCHKKHYDDEEDYYR